MGLRHTPLEVTLLHNLAFSLKLPITELRAFMVSLAHGCTCVKLWWVPSAPSAVATAATGSWIRPNTTFADTALLGYSVAVVSTDRG